MPLTTFCRWPCSHSLSKASCTWSVVVRPCQLRLLIAPIRNGLGTSCKCFSNALALPVGPSTSAYTRLAWLSKYSHHANALFADCMPMLPPGLESTAWIIKARLGNKDTYLARWDSNCGVSVPLLTSFWLLSYQALNILCASGENFKMLGLCSSPGRSSSMANIEVAFLSASSLGGLSTWVYGRLCNVETSSLLR